MATFVYLHPETSAVIERSFPCGQAPDSITLEDGTECERSLAAEVAGQNGHQASCWPMKSKALAVHPSQRDEYARFASEHGVATDFDVRGRPIFRSRKHRKRYVELVGATDFDGGYGDPNCT